MHIHGLYGCIDTRILCTVNQEYIYRERERQKEKTREKGERKRETERDREIDR